MRFDRKKLERYRELLQTTDIQAGYQEFLRLFRFLRLGLEKQLPDCRVQARIEENAMEYCYCQFTNSSMHSKGLKIAVAFVHGRFSLEVWLCGVNCAAQRKAYAQMQQAGCPFRLAEDPAGEDYILRVPVENAVDISDADVWLRELMKCFRSVMQYADGLPD